MTEQKASYRRILKTSSITGGASFINILIGLVRAKVLAVLLGPAGVGLASIYSSIISTASTIAAMGSGTAGTRQVADAVAKDDEGVLSLVRRALFWGVLILASAGALVVWSLREILAVYVLGSAEYSNVVGWLALGVALSVASSSQSGLLRGMRRVHDMAWWNVYTAVLNTVIGIAILLQWGSSALVAFVLVYPIVNFILGHVYVRRLPKNQHGAADVHEMAAQWKVMLRLGVALMGAGLAQTFAQLWIRMSINGEFGLDAVGHFQAAWSISMQYIGFVLAAMGADFYPRLTGVIHDKTAACRLVNEQAEIALLISAPIFIAMMGLVPWLIHLLYTAEFFPAVEILRWQILGDVLKVVSWPMSFVILASGAGKTVFWTETTTMLLMGGLVAGLISSMGLQITGIAVFVCYVYVLALSYFLASRKINFVCSASVVKLLGVTFLLCVGIFILSSYSSLAAAIVSMIVSLVFGLYTIGRLLHLADVGGAIGRLGALARKITSKIGINND